LDFAFDIIFSKILSIPFLKYGFLSTKSSILKLTVSLFVNIFFLISLFFSKYLSITNSTFDLPEPVGPHLNKKYLVFLLDSFTFYLILLKMI
jgi:hypothetical protein